MQAIPPVLVFCDLDDTLFDVHAFAVDASARRALNRLERQRLPVVLCSSRTRAEIELIQQELGINHPFVSESGAAVFLPRGYFAFDRVVTTEVSGYQRVEFGKPYQEAVAVLRRFAGRLGVSVVGFSDMSVGEVAIDCDIPLLQARLAKLREYSEMFRVVDSKPGAILRLFKALRGAGFVCTSRGRYHLLGACHHDVGGHFIRGLYRRAFGQVPTIAFGDHGSAAPLLRHADVPLVVQADDAGETRGLLATVPAARLIGARSVAEWAEAILEIANRAQDGLSMCSS
jgi:mannosyl-3-phosphoglycerate phosphatase family protein